MREGQLLLIIHCERICITFVEIALISEIFTWKTETISKDNVHINIIIISFIYYFKYSIRVAFNKIHSFINVLEF